MARQGAHRLAGRHGDGLMGGVGSGRKREAFAPLELEIPANPTLEDLVHASLKVASEVAMGRLPPRVAEGVQGPINGAIRARVATVRADEITRLETALAAAREVVLAGDVHASKARRHVEDGVVDEQVEETDGEKIH